MADFYPLIASAVERLPEQSPERRGVVYERARSALTDQLRALDPPSSQTEAAGLQQLLEDAISRVEGRYGAPAPAPQPPPIVTTDRHPRPAEETREAPTALRSQGRVDARPERHMGARNGATEPSVDAPHERLPADFVTRGTGAGPTRLKLAVIVLAVLGASAAAWLLATHSLPRPR